MSKNPSQKAQIKTATLAAKTATAATPASMHALEAKLARLESLQDHYEMQLEELESLLQRVGFEKGLISLRQAAEELLACELDNE